MDAFPVPNRGNGLALGVGALAAEATLDSTASAGVEAEAEAAPFVCPGVVPFVEEADPVRRCKLATGAGEALLLGIPMRLPISVRRLLTSAARSLMRASCVLLWASRALGMRLRIVRISSALRLASSSRLPSASLMAAMTDSSCVSALSRREVRASSASLRAFVSDSSWSRAAKALEKEAFIDSLSCVSCGAVGGLIRGRIYRCDSQH
jgi:hypothetical protein